MINLRSEIVGKSVACNKLALYLSINLERPVIILSCKLLDDSRVSAMVLDVEQSLIMFVSGTLSENNKSILIDSITQK